MCAFSPPGRAVFASCFSTQYLALGTPSLFAATLQPPLLTAVALLLSQANLTAGCALHLPMLLGGAPYDPVGAVPAAFTGTLRPDFDSAPAAPVCAWRAPAPTAAVNASANATVLYDVTAMTGYDRAVPGLFGATTACPSNTPLCLAYRLSPCYALACSLNASAASACQKNTVTATAKKSALQLQLGTTEYTTAGAASLLPPPAWVLPDNGGLTVEFAGGEGVLASGLTGFVVSAITDLAELTGLALPVDFARLQGEYAGRVTYATRCG